MVVPLGLPLVGLGELLGSVEVGSNGSKIGVAYLLPFGVRQCLAVSGELTEIRPQPLAPSPASAPSGR